MAVGCNELVREVVHQAVPAGVVAMDPDSEEWVTQLGREKL